VFFIIFSFRDDVLPKPDYAMLRVVILEKQVTLRRVAAVVVRRAVAAEYSWLVPRGYFEAIHSRIALIRALYGLWHTYIGHTLRRNAVAFHILNCRR
jgi:hypothetical protein